MTRPSTRAVRHAASELSEQVTPHLSTAKGALVEEVLPKVKATSAELLPKAKSAGVGVAATAARLAPKKRRPLRMAAIVGALALGAYAAWNAWRLPHDSDDWTHADSTAADSTAADSTAADSTAAGTESPAAGDAQAVPVGTGPIAG